MTDEAPGRRDIIIRHGAARAGSGAPGAQPGRVPAAGIDCVMVNGETANVA